LRDPGIAALVAQQGQAAVADACRTVLAQLRAEISAGHLDAERLALALTGTKAAVENTLNQALGHSLRRVINATGVILHTNLGRAPLSQPALTHIWETAGVYSNLEFDLSSGERGRRDVHVDRLFRALLAGVETTVAPSSGPGSTGAPIRAAAPVSTIVVNNNAAAVLLALNTLADGGEVIVSRGELVEIGGSFRIPDVMAKSGAVLREVGTTNRTRITDYERVINERTRLLLRVHRSNFEITGFTEQPAIEALAELAQKYRLPLMEDLGSGALFDLRQVGIQNEPRVLDRLRAGVHVVTCSGDKLLGGPQAGLISGREDLVKKMRSNSLFRALRVDKLTYAALEATLVAYLKKDYNAVPALRMMQISKPEIASRAQGLVRRLKDLMGEGARPTPVRPAQLRAELVDGESLIGGGSAPSAVLPTTLVAVTCCSLSANEFASRLRASDPPVIARLEEGRVLLDLRTVFPNQDEVLTQVLARAAAA
ncbi:MAG TPA: L-seryl-tRNA(Sec) selenium transferase, partial [Terriglobales bacterium]|nr:L-seryl-tRNA(Sec) selenium transferase [Terriglobales bacterium]